MRRLALAAVMLAPLATACTPNDPTLGGAIHNNYALQVINPEPQYEGTAMEGGDGSKAAKAVERYRTDQVKKPVSISTTSGTGGGSGSGSGSGGR